MEEPTPEEMVEIRKMFQQIMGEIKSWREELSQKMDEDMEEERRERKELHKFIMEKMDECHESIMEKMDECHKSTMEKLDGIGNNSKLFREELGNERTKEIKNDSKPEKEEIPNEKTKEPVVILPEFKTETATRKIIKKVCGGINTVTVN